jgi:hypothetical protein
VDVPTNVAGALAGNYGGLTPYSGETGSGLVDLNKMFDELAVGMGQIAKQQMTGAIPEDVQKQLRIMTAESSLGYGLGSGTQAAKFAEARNLGLMSMDIQKQGLATADATMKLAESKREYNKNYELNMAQYANDVRRTDLSAVELTEASRQFNVKMKLAADELAANTLMQYHALANAYVDTSSESSVSSAFSALTTDMKNILAKIKLFT